MKALAVALAGLMLLGVLHELVHGWGTMTLIKWITIAFPELLATVLLVRIVRGLPCRK